MFAISQCERYISFADNLLVMAGVRFSQTPQFSKALP